MCEIFSREKISPEFFSLRYLEVKIHLTYTYTRHKNTCYWKIFCYPPIGLCLEFAAVMGLANNLPEDGIELHEPKMKKMIFIICNVANWFFKNLPWPSPITHFISLIHIYTPWNRFPIFSSVVEKPLARNELMEWLLKLHRTSIPFLSFCKDIYWSLLLCVTVLTLKVSV